jgi:hypothetical protein
MGRGESGRKRAFGRQEDRMRDFVGEKRAWRRRPRESRKSEGFLRRTGQKWTGQESVLQQKRRFSFASPIA